MNTFAKRDRPNFSSLEASYNYLLVHLCCPHCRLLFGLTTSGKQASSTSRRSRMLRRDLPSKLSGSGHSGLVTPRAHPPPPGLPVLRGEDTPGALILKFQARELSFRKRGDFSSLDHLRPGHVQMSVCGCCGAAGGFLSRLCNACESVCVSVLCQV